ncbi:MAG: dsbG [Ramlibacter sp.]|jgi:thiol:disulfide interchange protein DsbG|nr:dsbG [Ramlibacter sp.]
MFDPMKTTHLLTCALLASLLALAGCKDARETAAPAAAAASATPVSIPAIATQAKGFTVGSTMSVRTVYVFFDPQCPHCAVLWNEAKPLKSQAKFVWIPVGLLNASSTPQGAALLAAPDPAAAMDAHEASMKERKGGITASGELQAQKAAVEANTKLMNSLQFNGVPTVVAKHAVTGDLVVKEGSMSTAMLAAALGLQPPAGN